MDAKLIADARALCDTVRRLERVGLVVEPAALSPASRRAAFAVQRAPAGRGLDAPPALPRIGFAYPAAR